MKKVVIAAVLSVLALSTSCKKENTNPTTPTGPTVDSRLPGTWESISYELSGVPGCGQQKETYEFQFDTDSQYSFSFISELQPPCSGESSSSEFGSFSSVVPSTTEKDEWAAEFPNDGVSLDLKISLTSSASTKTYFFQFLNSNTKYRLFWEQNGDKFWREYTKQ